MAMSRKDYVAIAAAIKRHAEAGGLGDAGVLYNNGAKNVARDLADIFERDNYRFQRSRFIEACGAASSDPWEVSPGAKLARAANSANGR